ncbi:hypothetical protein B0H14DRAFT_2650113 [Mycena olivaceomarginata]|nr:hypothetical protein B0H14DRAFT_2650113 [Mycena olivaceomarginata]
MSKCWTTLLRYQVLDVLLAMRSGTSDMPCLVRPMPTGTQQVELLTSLSTWPTRFSNFQTSWRNKLDRDRKESKKKSRKVKTTVTEGGYPDGVVAGFEAWALSNSSPGNHQFFLQKTTKNLQAMGTALTWILESRASAEELYPTTTLVNTLYQATPASGPSAGRCRLSTCYGHCQKARARHATIEVSTARIHGGPVADCRSNIAIGTPVDIAINKFLALESVYLTNIPPPDVEDQNIFLPTALASTICSAPEGAADLSGWSSLITFEDPETTGQDDGPISINDSTGSGGKAASNDHVDGLESVKLKTQAHSEEAQVALGSRCFAGVTEHTAAEAVAITTKGGKRKKRILTLSDRSAKNNQDPSEGTSSDEAVKQEEDDLAKTKTETRRGSLTRERVVHRPIYPNPKRPRCRKQTPKSTLERWRMWRPCLRRYLTKVLMWGYRPDGSKRNFVFPLHQNSAHAEKPMLEQLQTAIERQQTLSNWPKLFISGMLVGELDGGVEESISMLHRLDEQIEVQVNGLRKPPKSTKKRVY